MKLYFIGGEFTEERNCRHLNIAAFKEVKSPKVLFFQWTREKEEKKYRKIMSSYFKELGAKTDFAELTDSFSQLSKKIKSSNVIYLPGGNPQVLLKNLKKKKISFKNYPGVIIGNSAGTLVMCKKYAVIKGQSERKKSHMEPGLGLADISVSVHYQSKRKGYAGISPDAALKKLSKNTKIYSIPETSAIIYDNSSLSFIGPVYLFKNGKKSLAI